MAESSQTRPAWLRPRPPQTLRTYGRRLAGWNFVIWFLLLWWGGNVGHYWLQQDGRLDPKEAATAAGWSGFVALFVTVCATTVQARRRLLLGRLDPDPDEWRFLEKAPPRPLPPGFFLLALLLATVFSWAMYGIARLGSWMAERGPDRREFLFFAAFLPALGSAMLVPWLARRSLLRFVPAMELSPPLRLHRRRYILLHNVLPYALFNTALGVGMAFARFGHQYREGLPVLAHDLALHLSGTTFFISLFVVGAARVKARVDLLSPIVLSGPRSGGRRRRYRLWLPFVLPFLVYPSLRLLLLPADPVSLGVAVAIKVLVCMTISLTVSYWAVASVLRDIEERELSNHPYVLLYRALKNAGWTRRPPPPAPAR